jgi:hypothetical protein
MRFNDGNDEGKTVRRRRDEDFEDTGDWGITVYHPLRATPS